ncbi:MAG: hypothetical protein K9I47_08075 [Bacteroidales bacterium]|nr:hypothetical protein [Bacteroidales bacterium]
MIRKAGLLLFVFIFMESSGAFGQKSAFRQFFDLSLPEIGWVFLHPFSAPKAYKTGNEAREIVDSLKQNNIMDGDTRGGKLDAFKHTYWMARLGQEIRIKWARKLGEAHEKGNKIEFFRNRDTYYPANDSVSSVMDCWNNKLGLDLAKRYPAISSDSLQTKVLQAIRKGRARIVKKNAEGEFLDEKGSVLPRKKLKGQWSNGKVLVPSDYVYPHNK